MTANGLVKVVYFHDLERNTKVHRYIKFKDKGHYYIKCDETLPNKDGVLCVCGMKPVRSDHFKDWLRQNVHVCTPGVPCNQTSIDGSFHLHNPIEGDVIITEEMLYNEMAVLTGKLNLSLNVLTSDAFYKFACKLIAYGLCQYSVKGSYSQSHILFPQLHRDKLRQTMVQLAYQKHQEVLGRFSDQPYNCLALDAGTTFGTQYLHFVLENSLAGLPPYACRSDILSGSKAVNYVPVIVKGLYFISLAKVKIGSIVIDGNTAQIKALSPLWKKSVFYSKEIDNPKKLIIIPCLCHRCHNAYKYIAEHNGEMITVVTELHDVASRYNTLRDDSLPECPKHCETRWAYDFYIASFILKYKEQIQDVLDDDDINFDKFIHLHQILCIFKALISIFESPKTTFSSAFIHLERGINALYQLHYVDKNPYAYYFAKSLEKYTLKSDEGGLWSLAYSLTPNGRADFRKRNIEGFKIEDKNWLGFFNISDYSSDDESDYSTPDGEEVILALDDLQSEDAETNIAASEEEDDSDLPDNEEYYIHLNTNFTDHLQAAKGVLKKLLQNRGFNEKDAEDTITHYNGYIESCVETFSSLRHLKMIIHGFK